MRKRPRLPTPSDSEGDDLPLPARKGGIKKTVSVARDLAAAQNNAQTAKASTAQERSLPLDAILETRDVHKQSTKRGRSVVQGQEADKASPTGLQASKADTDEAVQTVLPDEHEREAQLQPRNKRAGKRKVGQDKVPARGMRAPKRKKVKGHESENEDGDNAVADELQTKRFVLLQRSSSKTPKCASFRLKPHSRYQKENDTKPKNRAGVRKPMVSPVNILWLYVTHSGDKPRLSLFPTPPMAVESDDELDLLR